MSATGSLSPLLAAADPLLGAGPAISTLEILLIIAGGVLLFLFVRLVRWAFPLLRIARGGLASWARVGPLAEALLWLVYLVSVIAWTLQEHHLVRLGALGALALGVVIAIWFVIRDYLSGVILRTEGALSVGDVVRIGEIEGQITRFRARAVELELSHGDRVILPYRALRDAPIVRRRTHRAAVRHTFTLALPSEVGFDAARSAIRRAALLSHWVSPSHDPKITARDRGTLEVTIHALTDVRAAEVEQVVRDALRDAAETAPERAAEPQ